MWAFLAFFVVLAASTFWFLTHPGEHPRGLDGARSVLVALPSDLMEARIVVLAVPDQAAVRATPQPPDEAGGTWRVLVDWTTESVAGEAPQGGEQTVRAMLPRAAEVDVVDRRWRPPEHLLLRFAPAAGPR